MYILHWQIFDSERITVKTSPSQTSPSQSVPELVKTSPKIGQNVPKMIFILYFM